MIEFKALEWFEISGRGWVALVECDQERSRDQPGLTGQDVKIDGHEYTVVGVERRMPSYAIRKAEPIGLLIRGERKS